MPPLGLTATLILQEQGDLNDKTFWIDDLKINILPGTGINTYGQNVQPV